MVAQQNCCSRRHVQSRERHVIMSARVDLPVLVWLENKVRPLTLTAQHKVARAVLHFSDSTGVALAVSDGRHSLITRRPCLHCITL